MKKTRATFNTLNTVTTAMLCALGVILAATFHHLAGPELAALFSAMHLPVFLAGILCGQWLGLICGFLTPLISFMSSGRPPFPSGLIPMIAELSAYGFLSGLLRSVFIKNPKTNKFSSVLALVISMIVGRVLAALTSAIILSAGGAPFFASLWTSFLGKFTSSWVGIIIQLVLIPAIMFTLQRSGILLKYLPEREPTVNSENSSAVCEQPNSDRQDEIENTIK